MDALTVLHRRNFRLRQRALGMVVDAPGPTAFVVDRHPRMCAQWMTRARRNYRIPGYDPRRDAPVIFTTFGIAARTDQKATGKFFDLEQRHAVLFVIDIALRALEQRILVELAAMQPGNVA